MPPCAADRFEEMLVRLLTVCDRRFDTAPNFERWMLTVWIALSMALIAAIALEGLSRVGPDDELLEELEDPVVVDDEPEELPEPLELPLPDAEDMPVSNIVA